MSGDEPTVRALVIPVAGPARIDWIGPDDSAAMRAIVGGWLEGVALPEWGAFMFVDEEGRLTGREMNLRASMLARQTIVGDVVVFGEAGVEVGDVPDALVAEVGAA